MPEFVRLWIKWPENLQVDDANEHVAMIISLGPLKF